MGTLQTLTLIFIHCNIISHNILHIFVCIFTVPVQFTVRLLIYNERTHFKLDKKLQQLYCGYYYL